MKKILQITLLVLFVFALLSFTACKDKGKDNQNGNDGTINKESVFEMNGLETVPPEYDVEGQIVVTLDITDCNGGKHIAYKVLFKQTNIDTFVDDFSVFTKDNLFKRFTITVDGVKIDSAYTITKDVTLKLVENKPAFKLTLEWLQKDSESDIREYNCWGPFTFEEWLVGYYQIRKNADTPERFEYNLWMARNEFEYRINGKAIADDYVIDKDCTITMSSYNEVYSSLYFDNQVYCIGVSQDMYAYEPITLEQYFKINHHIFGGSDVLKYYEIFTLFVDGKEIPCDEWSSFKPEGHCTVVLRYKENVTLTITVEHLILNKTYGPYYFDVNFEEDKCLYSHHIEEKLRQELGEEIYQEEIASYTLGFEGDQAIGEIYYSGTVTVDVHRETSGCQHENKRQVESLCYNKNTHYYCDECDNYFYYDQYQRAIKCEPCNNGGIKSYNVSLKVDGKEYSSVLISSDYEIYVGMPLCSITGDFMYMFACFDVYYNGNVITEDSNSIITADCEIELKTKDGKKPEDYGFYTVEITYKGKAEKYFAGRTSLYEILNFRYEQGDPTVCSYWKNCRYMLEDGTYISDEVFIDRDLKITIVEGLGESTETPNPPETPDQPEAPSDAILYFQDKTGTISVKEMTEPAPVMAEKIYNNLGITDEEYVLYYIDKKGNRKELSYGYFLDAGEYTIEIEFATNIPQESEIEVTIKDKTGNFDNGYITKKVDEMSVKEVVEEAFNISYDVFSTTYTVYYINIYNQRQDLDGSAILKVGSHVLYIAYKENAEGTFTIKVTDKTEVFSSTSVVYTENSVKTASDLINDVCKRNFRSFISQYRIYYITESGKMVELKEKDVITAKNSTYVIDFATETMVKVTVNDNTGLFYNIAPFEVKAGITYKKLLASHLGISSTDLNDKYKITVTSVGVDGEVITFQLTSSSTEFFYAGTYTITIDML